jgi:PIN domain nuclease of toxin-antitoxin system
MKILLDTHIFLWAVSAPDRLSEKWQFELESQANLVYLSAISVAEIMIKSSTGKLNVQFDPLDIAVKSGFELLDFTAQDALLLKDLPFHHRDPFDRMLIAQGLQNRMSLMTDDSKFRLYECRLFR